MKSLESAFESLKEGSVLSISKTLKTDNYDATIIRFDGNVMKEVNVVDMGNFLNMFHNILNELDKRHICQISYNYKTKMYQSIFLKKVDHGMYQPSTLEVISELVTNNLDMIKSIIELDAKIANINKQRPVVKRRKIS